MSKPRTQHNNPGQGPAAHDPVKESPSIVVPRGCDPFVSTGQELRPLAFRTLRLHHWEQEINVYYKNLNTSLGLSRCVCTNRSPVLVLSIAHQGDFEITYKIANNVVVILFCSDVLSLYKKNIRLMSAFFFFDAIQVF